MKLFKMLLLPMLLLVVACTTLNTKIGLANEKESEQDLKELIKLKQNAQVAYQNNDWEKSAEYYERLSQRIPNDAEIWFRLGNAYARLNKHGAALQSYQQALRNDSKNSKVWHNMGIIQLKLATQTFVEMQEYITPDDPLSIRAIQLVDGISRLLKQDVSKSDAVLQSDLLLDETINKLPSTD